MKAHAALVLAAVSLSACTSAYDKTDITDVTQPAEGAVVDFRVIRIAEGTVVTAHVIPYNDDGHPLPGTVESEDTSVLEVRRALGNRWAFIGRAPGTTRVRLRCEGAITHVIGAEVVGAD